MKNIIRKLWETHRQAFENRTYGEPCDDWKDAEGNICIRYSTGKWFHYRITGSGVEWW